MIRHILVGESGTVLRTMLIAAALADAAPAACTSRGGRGSRGGDDAAGVMSGAGAEWDVHPGGGHSDSGCDLRRMGRGYDVCACRDYVDVDKRITLIGDGADVRGC